ncbi:substrate-binding periplasmic protein [Pseudobacteriovorax antillogorgiicola]|uniref:Polar amino acid transport system substrate-binding protein n=1 Tax=Pseudobacteriovorax antillogorgiicola TaxID=1513793 RepID=A0A1Y6BV92_9BACT|nr:transporter substrate-binding domain-containing protein [Pseudobacteriovorax antillogorgiicola]TCS52401.1 polar amino acid transport system substrate-binding protein [Pseudobacteriovorax antillogorgiicola]SMF29001.1 polar amino acid transport system substrate-binding protein [Pseudobacteriovorax antillogorgiicola]
MRRLLWCVITLCHASQGLSKEPKSLTVCLGNQEKFPIYRKIGDENKPFPGYFFDFLEELSKKLKIPVRYERHPWPRCLAKLQQGKLDAVCAGSYKKDREDVGLFPKKPDGTVDESRKVNANGYYLYVLQDSGVDWDGERFINLKKPLGTITGYSVIDRLERLGATIDTARNDQLNLKKLLLGRLDGVVTHETSGQLFTNHPNIRKVEPPISSKPYYIIISHALQKTYPGYADKIWDTMVEVRDAPEMQERYRSYWDLEDWQ